MSTPMPMRITGAPKRDGSGLRTVWCVACGLQWQARFDKNSRPTNECPRECRTRSGDQADYSYQEAREVERLCVQWDQLVYRVVFDNFLGRLDESIVRKVGGEDEFYSEAHAALMSAARRFQKELGFKFSTYAVNSMIRRVHHMVASRMRGYREMVSLSEFRSGDDDELFEPVEAGRHGDECRQEAGERVVPYRGRGCHEAVVILKRVRGLVNRLPEREARVLKMRLWEDKSLREISDAIGVSKERVRQIEQRGIERVGEKLRKRIRQGAGRMPA